MRKPKLVRILNIVGSSLIAIVIAVVIIIVCTPVTFDASTPETVKESEQKLKNSLEKSQQAHFIKALTYLENGGKKKTDFVENVEAQDESFQDGLKRINEDAINRLDGLSAAEILTKYKFQKRIDDAATLRENKKAKELLEQIDTYVLINDFANAEDLCQTLMQIPSKKLVGQKKLYEVLIKDDLYAKKIEVHEQNLTLQEQLKKYQKEVAVIDFQAQRINTAKKDNLPGVHFNLKNNGNKTLNYVEVTVYFLNKYEKPFDEASFVLVDSSLGFSFENDIAIPLRAHDTKKMGEGNFFVVNKPLKEWTGQAVYHVTQVKFSQ
jgi:hypothetical protein